MMAAPGVVVPHLLPWHRRLVAALVAFLLGLFLKTWRVRWRDSGSYPETKGNVIFCVWHNRLPVALACYNDFLLSRWPDKGVAAMISASRDGSLLANIVERFGVQPVRGSTSRRGPQALLEATTWMERGYSFVMTPDGPRPPAYKIKEGIIQLAQLTGRPIIPTSNFIRWKLRLPTWDRLQIPLPFAVIHSYYGEPIWVPRDATDDQRERLRAELESSMLALTKD